MRRKLDRLDLRGKGMLRSTLKDLTLKNPVDRKNVHHFHLLKNGRLLKARSHLIEYLGWRRKCVPQVFQDYEASRKITFLNLSQ